jgi:endoglucanase
MSRRWITAGPRGVVRKHPWTALAIAAALLATGLVLMVSSRDQARTSAADVTGAQTAASAGSGSAAPASVSLGEGAGTSAGAAASGTGASGTGASGTGAAAPAKPDAGIAFPLHTSGASVVDADGKPVKLGCVNWYGSESSDFVAGGLKYESATTIINEIVSMGFDCVRLPYSNQMWQSNPVVSGSLTTANPSFNGEHARTIYASLVQDMASAGLMVILDDHNSNAEWCCSSSDGNALWYNSSYPQSAWLSDWQSVTSTFRNIPQVIGVDLRNEPRGSAAWGGGNSATDWHAAAELGGNAVLSVDPRMLIFVEGTNYATDLSDVLSDPVVLSQSDHVVYELHDYGFDTTVTSYDQWVSKIQSNWGYLVGKVPLWVGEFGTCNTSDQCVDSPTSAQLGMWFSVFTRYLSAHNLNWSYWAVNGTKSDGLTDGNSGQVIKYGETETYGVLNTGWSAPARASLLSALQGIQASCPAGPVANGTYYIKNRSSGDVIDIPAFNSAQGTVLDQWPLNHGVNQKWVVTRLSCYLYSIRSAMDGESADILSQSTSSGAKVDQYDYWGGGNQQFLIVRNSAGYYTISSINSLDPVEVPGSSATAGTQLEQGNPAGTANQQWSFSGA